MSKKHVNVTLLSVPFTLYDNAYGVRIHSPRHLLHNYVLHTHFLSTTAETVSLYTETLNIPLKAVAKQFNGVYLILIPNKPALSHCNRLNLLRRKDRATEYNLLHFKIIFHSSGAAIVVVVVDLPLST